MNVPDYREDDEEPGRERFYRRDLDPRRWLMERDGELRITWPDGHVSHDDPASVLARAA